MWIGFKPQKASRASWQGVVDVIIVASDYFAMSFAEKCSITFLTHRGYLKDELWNYKISVDLKFVSFNCLDLCCVPPALFCVSPAVSVSTSG